MRTSFWAILLFVCGCGGTTPQGLAASLDLGDHTVTVVISQNGGPPPCVPAQVVNPVADCRVLDVQRDANGAVVASDAMPPCNAPGGRSPCWEILSATPACPAGQFSVGRTMPPPPATTAEAVCALR